ncbi:MAG: hypothetical protein PXZ08_06105 [Actinomycetota bacterium]|nr:hypothetical protein [Actinomycetota bacterium]
MNNASKKKRHWWIRGTLTSLAWSALSVGAASAAVMSATIVDAANTFSSGTLVLRSTSGVVSCDSSVATVSTNVASCPGSTLPTVPLTTTPASASVALSNLGTLPPSLGRLDVTTCGAQEAVSATGTDTALAYGDVSFGDAGPLGATAVTLGPSSGDFSTLNAYSGPNVFTQVAWFKTTTSGSIFSFSNTYPGAAPNSWDRMIWIDKTGHVVAGVYPQAVREVRSPNTYADAQWHFVAVTLDSSGATSGLRLYVDGALVATDASVTSAQRYVGYWHIGWSNAQRGWSDPPANAFFTGSLAGVGVLSSALSAASIAALYASASMSAYSTNLSANGPVAYWPLDDTGTRAYVGAIPAVASPCALVHLTVATTQGTVTTCEAPASSGACAAPSAAFTAATALNVVVPTVTTTSPVTITTTMDVGGAVNINASGLRLLIPETYVVQASSFSATLNYPQAVVRL